MASVIARLISIYFYIFPADMNSIIAAEVATQESKINFDSFAFPAMSSTDQAELKSLIRMAIGNESNVKMVSWQRCLQLYSLFLPSWLAALLLANHYTAHAVSKGVFEYIAYSVGVILFGSYLTPRRYMGRTVSVLIFLVPLFLIWPLMEKSQQIENLIDSQDWKIPTPPVGMGTLHAMTEAHRLRGLGIAILYLAVLATIFYVVSFHRRRHSAAIREKIGGPYDKLICDWSRAVRALMDARTGWPRRALMATADSTLRALAQNTRKELCLLWLYRDDTPALRERERSEAEMVAAAVGSYRAKIIGSASGPEYDDCIDGLLSGLAALAHGSRTMLLANLVPGPPNPQPTWQDTAKRIARKVFPSAILAGAAIGIPFIPGFGQEDAISTNLRITLLVAAALSLLSAPGDVAERINEVVAKALPRRGE